MAVASPSEVLWVRLKPRDPQRGYKLRRYTVFGYTFSVERNWYKIPSKVKGLIANEDVNVDMKTYMAEIRNDNDNPDSALAFDVCTKEEAAAISKREREAKEKNQADNPVDLTTGDFGRNRREAAAKRAPGRPRRDRDED